MVRMGLGVCLAAVAMAAASATALGVTDFYVYANWGLAGGWDLFGADTYQVDPLNGYAFVHRANGNVTVYKITMTDDGDGIINYHQHPLNPASLGVPMEPRSIALVGSYAGAPGTPSECGLYAANGTLYMGVDNGIYAASWNTATGAVTSGWTQIGPILGNSASWDVQTMALDESGGVFYAGFDNRDIYSLRDTNINGSLMDETWIYEFTHLATPGGGHHDGLEFVNGKLWATDMTSAYLLLYEKVGGVWRLYDKNGNGVYNEIGDAFTYPFGAPAVEGMGFGLFDHFWMSDGANLYEVGGGAVQQHVVIPEPLTLAAFGLGLGALGTYVRRRRS